MLLCHNISTKVCESNSRILDDLNGTALYASLLMSYQNPRWINFAFPKCFHSYSTYLIHVKYSLLCVWCMHLFWLSSTIFPSTQVDTLLLWVILPVHTEMLSSWKTIICAGTQQSSKRYLKLLSQLCNLGDLHGLAYSK